MPSYYIRYIFISIVISPGSQEPTHYNSLWTIQTLRVIPEHIKHLKAADSHRADRSSRNVALDHKVPVVLVTAHAQQEQEHKVQVAHDHSDPDARSHRGQRVR